MKTFSGSVLCLPSHRIWGTDLDLPADVHNRSRSLPSRSTRFLQPFQWFEQTRFLSRGLRVRWTCDTNFDGTSENLNKNQQLWCHWKSSWQNIQNGYWKSGDISLQRRMESSLSRILRPLHVVRCLKTQIYLWKCTHLFNCHRQNNPAEKYRKTCQLEGSDCQKENIFIPAVFLSKTFTQRHTLHIFLRNETIVHIKLLKFHLLFVDQHPANFQKFSTWVDQKIVVTSPGARCARISPSKIHQLPDACVSIFQLFSNCIQFFDIHPTCIEQRLLFLDLVRWVVQVSWGQIAWSALTSVTVSAGVWAIIGIFFTAGCLFPSEILLHKFLHTHVRSSMKQAWCLGREQAPRTAPWVVCWDRWMGNHTPAKQLFWCQGNSCAVIPIQPQWHFGRSLLSRLGMTAPKGASGKVRRHRLHPSVSAWSVQRKLHFAQERQQCDVFELEGLSNLPFCTDDQCTRIFSLYE